MDIIFFAAIAFYVFLKLRGQLGKIDEGEKRQIQDKLSKKRKLLESLQDQMLVGQHKTKDANDVTKAAKDAQNKINEEITSLLDEKSKKHFFKAIESCNISTEFFLNGTKTAFEMIIKAFASNDLETLKFLLNGRIYSGFENSINQRKESKQTLISNLISIEKSEIVAASMVGKEASITVKFITQQINYVIDQDEKIIEGSKSEIAELTDIWTFKKDVTLNNPNWTIVSTNSN